MRRNIIIAKKAISADLCNMIIETGKRNSFERATTGNGEDPVNRKSSISWLSGSMRYLEIYQPIQSLINQVNSQFFFFDLTEFEPLQITKYDEKIKDFTSLIRMAHMIMHQKMLMLENYRFQYSSLTQKIMKVVHLNFPMIKKNLYSMILWNKVRQYFFRLTCNMELSQ